MCSLGTYRCRRSGAKETSHPSEVGCGSRKMRPMNDICDISVGKTEEEYLGGKRLTQVYVENGCYDGVFAYVAYMYMNIQKC